MDGVPNLCLSCGACCALYKVTFQLSEADDMKGGIVPVLLTVKIGESRRAMKGTEGKKPRCVALEGKIGAKVCCSIYDRRPTPCRIFRSSWDRDISNWLCDRARTIYGLQPFSPFWFFSAKSVTVSNQPRCLLPDGYCKKNRWLPGGRTLSELRKFCFQYKFMVLYYI
jgi:Fe-S-cluster containining protein